MEKTNSRYTYQKFADEVIILAADALKGKLVTAEVAERIIQKAEALRATQAKKAEYNATNPKKSAPKGASDATKEKAATIAAVLGIGAENALTTAEINVAAGTNYNALEVSNAIRFIDNTDKTKVVRDVVSPKGLKAQKEYTAYFVKAE